MQVSSIVGKLRKEVCKTFVLSNSHVPSKASWNLAVNRALQIIGRADSPLIKVLKKLYATPFNFAGLFLGSTSSSGS